MARKFIVAVAAALILVPGLKAQPEDAGEFEVRTATTDLVNGVYTINALIYLRLPSEATRALHSSLPLTISIEIQFLNRLRLWWDTTAAEVTQRFELRYLSVTDRYVVTNINADLRRGFSSLSEALDFIGQIDELPVVDAALLDDDRRYDIRIRAGLDKDELPGPLRLLAFWRGDWSIESDWLQWRLDDE
jgi:hypothetical protein